MEELLVIVVVGFIFDINLIMNGQRKKTSTIDG